MGVFVVLVYACVCVCVGGEVREKGIEGDMGLTTVLLLLQPKWQALACVPIPILCSSLRVLESFQIRPKLSCQKYDEVMN